MTTTSSSFAGRWNQWRGPNRDGSLVEGQWPRQLSEDHLQEIWRVKLEPSYSGPIVEGGHIFVTETKKESDESVRAFSLEGEQQWQASWPGAMRVPFFARSNGSWIRSTPAVADGRLLVGGIRDVLVCLDAVSGEEIWRNDFVQSQGSPLPSFGFVCSPLINGDFAYVQAGGGLLKVAMESGQVVWRSLDDGGGIYGSAFSSPVLDVVDDTEQLLVQTRTELCGVAPEDGRKLWGVKVPAFRGMNIVPPTVSGTSVFTTSYGGGSFCFDVRQSRSGWKAEQKWKNTIQGYMSSPSLMGDHIYVHLKNRRFTCIELSTGRQKWSSRPFGKYWSTVTCDDLILALDERGELLLVAPDPTEFKLIDRRQVADDAWAHLAVVDDLVIVRDLNALIVYRWA